ncbi:formyltetrahydrofolate deformylase [Melioribacter sp. OK-6-Me]|uniref:formyltetrahydrofolate deformylase n=1 Tax=unclassified Melioribacter TaxID=2627329 RepID=UPI003ED9D432
MSSATLILSCADRKGLVAKISQFLFQRDANIIDLDEHVDKNEKMFFIRIEWELNGQANVTDEFINEFKKLTEEINANWDIKLSEEKKRLAIFVSRYDHCLLEILWRYRNNELHAEIPLIISNHPDLEVIARQYNIPFYCFPITKENKRDQEEKELELLKEHNIESIILARYMQILTPEFIAHYPNNIINIHHSFLPAFSGADPYKKAYERGVKLIGATSHYVTEELDEGPIIEQDVIRISHKDSLKDLIRKGRDLERLVLARAVDLHVNNRVLQYGKKTIIFR